MSNSNMNASAEIVSSDESEHTTSLTYDPNRSYTPTITVTEEIVPLLVQHGMELFWDGSTPTQRLDDRDNSSKFTRFVNARIEGKLSEVAFTQLLEQQFGVPAAVDLRIYGDYTTTDNGDLYYLVANDGTKYEPGVEFDIKKTKPWNSWLAIREEIYDKIDPEAPVLLTKSHIDSELHVGRWENTGDFEEVSNDDTFRERLTSYTDAMFPVEVEFVGSAYPHEFTDHFDQGDRLYTPGNKSSKLGPPLKRSNKGIPVQDLDTSPHRWNRIIADICSNMPNDEIDYLTIAEQP